MNKKGEPCQDVSGTTKVETEHIDVETGNLVTKSTQVASVALADALEKDRNDKHTKWSLAVLPIYLILGLATLNDVGNGYDGSIMSSMNAMEAWHAHFKVGMQGSQIGLIFSIYTVGNLVGAMLAAPIANMLGRRVGMFTGACLISAGTIVEATAPNIGQFMGGRFIIGMGVTIASSSGSIYIVEFAPPQMRGLFGGLYHSVGYYVGALAASWTCYGTKFLKDNWSWKIPVLVQLFPAGLIICLVFLLPESPRYLISKGKLDSARAVLVKYHGGGNPNSAVVNLEMMEIEQSTTFDHESRDDRWWDYRPLFNNRPARYRVLLLLLVKVFSQFIGGAVISYYLPVILQNIGIKSSSKQLLINALNIVFSLLSAVCGSFFVEKIGRRPLFLWGTFLTGVVYIPMNVIAALARGHVSTGAGYAFIAFIFLYGIFYSFTWTPLQVLYPAEILNNDIRAQGVAFSSFASGLASFINTYATPIALQKTNWKTYTIFLILHFVQLFVMWLTMVETKGRSLEELEEIFKDPKPVKRSLETHEVILVEGKGVKLELS